MANGTTDEKIARADRIREQSAKAQTAAAQNRQATQNSITNLRRSKLPSYTGDDEVSEVTVNVKGIHGRAPLPRAARTVLAIALALALVIVAAGWVYVQVLRAR